MKINSTINHLMNNILWFHTFFLPFININQYKHFPKISQTSVPGAWRRSSIQVASSIILTHSCLEIYLINVVRTCPTFGNNFSMRYQFTNYLKRISRLSFNEQLSFKYFIGIAFLERYYKNGQAVLTIATGMKGLR